MCLKVVCELGWDFCHTFTNHCHVDSERIPESKTVAATTEPQYSILKATLTQSLSFRFLWNFDASGRMT